MPGFSSLDLVALQILIAVSETGSLSAAGRKVGMTQQAASVPREDPHSQSPAVSSPAGLTR